MARTRNARGGRRPRRKTAARKTVGGKRRGATRRRSGPKRGGFNAHSGAHSAPSQKNPHYGALTQPRRLGTSAGADRLSKLMPWGSGAPTGPWRTKGLICDGVHCRSTPRLAGGKRRKSSARRGGRKTGTRKAAVRTHDGHLLSGPMPLSDYHLPPYSQGIPFWKSIGCKAPGCPHTKQVPWHPTKLSPADKRMLGPHWSCSPGAACDPAP